MRQCLGQKHHRPQGQIRFQICCPHLIAAAVQADEKHQVEHAVKHKARTQEHEVGVHTHGVILAGLQLCRQQAKQSCDDHRQQLHQHRERHRSAHRVPLAKGEQGRVIDVLLLPHIQKCKEKAQGNIEKCHRIRIVGNQQHDPG